jgi:signal transduction histidine kinase
MPNRHQPAPHKARPLYHSVFFRLFIVMLGAVILTYVAFGGFYRSEWNASNRIESHPSLIYYWGLLVDKLGYPPDTVFAAKLSREIGVAIAVSGPSREWRSENFSPQAWAQAAASGSEESPRMYMQGGRIWGEISRNGYSYYFGSRRRSALEGLSTDSFSLLVVIALVWFASWMLLRRVLRPLKRLEAGVEAVEAGDLDVQIAEEGRDEFSRLARSFNSMTRSLSLRLKSRDQLLLDVSHELRSPLTRMLLALEIPDRDKADRRLRKEIGLLDSMASEILETERLQSPTGGLTLIPTDLEKLVREKAEPYFNRGLEVAYIASRLPMVYIDPDRIGLVLQNIFENAIKYGRNDSRPASVYLRAEDRCLLVEVQDFGIGIPEKDLPFIFEPFYRVDPSRSRVRGYGLGLGLCKRIVELHHGKILVESRFRETTTVTIRLPV